MKTEYTYTTLCFKTARQAIKNEKEIIGYFGSRITISQVLKGTDERGQNGFFIQYNLIAE